MNICKAALTVAKRHLTYILFYLVAFSLIMTAILFQSVSDTHGSSPTYSPYTSRVAGASTGTVTPAASRPACGIILARSTPSCTSMTTAARCRTR